MLKFYPQIDERRTILQSFSGTFHCHTVIHILTRLCSINIVQISCKICHHLSFENYTDRLILANHSLKQLNVIDDSRHTGKMRSVGAMLNCCMTSMGKRRFICNHNLNNPSTNHTTLNNSYAITDYLLVNNMWSDLRDKLNGVKDIEKFNRKLIIGKVSPKDFAMLFDDLRTIGSLHDVTIVDGPKLQNTFIILRHRDVSLMCS